MTLICRICLNYIDKNMLYYTTDDMLAYNTVKSMMEACIPQLRVFVVEKPVVCCSCMVLLWSAFKLKNDSQKSETRITNYLLQTGLNPKHVNLQQVLAFERNTAQRSLKRHIKSSPPASPKKSRGKHANKEKCTLSEWPPSQAVPDFALEKVTGDCKEAADPNFSPQVMNSEASVRSPSPEDEIMLFHNYAKKPCLENLLESPDANDEILLMPKPDPPFSCSFCTFHCNSSIILLDHLRTHNKYSIKQMCNKSNQMIKTKMKQPGITDGFLGYSQSEISVSREAACQWNSWPFLAWLTPQVIVEKLDE